MRMFLVVLVLVVVMAAIWLFIGIPGMADAPLKDRLDHRTGPVRGLAMRASEIAGVAVVNDHGEHLGKIEDVVLDMRSGNIRYAALEVGGVLGIGGKLFAVPWNALKLETNVNNQKNHFVVSNVTPQQLENAPGFDREIWPNYARENWVSPENDAPKEHPREQEPHTPARHTH